MNLTLESLAVYFGDAAQLTIIGQRGLTIEKWFLKMPVFLGIPQAVLNVSVLICLSLILSRTAASKKPAFIFIGNLALVDTVLVLVEITIVQLRMSRSELPLSDWPNVCRTQMGLWIFTLTNTVFSSVIITVDRYLFITRCIRYPAIVTPSRMTYALVMAWVLPAVYATTSAISYNNSGDAECVVGHMVPRLYIALTITMLASIYITFYLLYSLILLKFYRRRNRLEKMRSMESANSFRLKSFKQKENEINFHQTIFRCWKTKILPDNWTEPVSLTKFTKCPHFENINLCSQFNSSLKNKHFNHTKKVQDSDCKCDRIDFQKTIFGCFKSSVSVQTPESTITLTKFEKSYSSKNISTNLYKELNSGATQNIENENNRDISKEDLVDKKTMKLAESFSSVTVVPALSTTSRIFQPKEVKMLSKKTMDSKEVGLFVEDPDVFIEVNSWGKDMEDADEVNMVDRDLPPASPTFNMVDRDLPPASPIFNMVDRDLPSASPTFNMVDRDLPSASPTFNMVDRDLPPASPIFLRSPFLLRNVSATFSTGTLRSGRSSTTDSLASQLLRMGKFIKSAKYVLILLLAFSLSWLPWLIVLVWDVIIDHYDKGGVVCQKHHFFFKLKEEKNFLEWGLPKQLTNKQTLQAQACIHRLLRKQVGSCLMDVPDYHVCQTIMQAIHTFRQDYSQMFALMVGVTNSILNPLIYGFWYPEFRQTLYRTAASLKRILGPSIT